MIQLDLSAFRRDYHNPELTASQVAKLHNLDEGNISQIAKRRGIATRRELGIRANSRKLFTGVPGARGCNDGCCCWLECNRNKGQQDMLPCEVYAFLDENPAILDNTPNYHPAIPLSILSHLGEDFE